MLNAIIEFFVNEYFESFVFREMRVCIISVILFLIQKKTRRIERMRISFSLLKENLKLSKRSSSYLHNSNCSLTSSLKSALELLSHALF